MIRILTFSVLLTIPVQLFCGSTSLDYLNRVLSFTSGQADKSTARLSSGKMQLADDPSSYAIYERLESIIRALDKNIGNMEDMHNYYLYQDGVLGTIIDSMQRIRELALERLNGILADSDREIIDSEIDGLYSGIMDALKQSEINKIKVFGKLLDDALIKKAMESAKHYELSSVDQLLDFFIKQRTYAGIKAKRLEYSISGEKINKENSVKARQKGDTDFALELSNLKLQNLKLLINLTMMKLANP